MHVFKGLIKSILNALKKTKYEIALITNPRLSATELLREMIFQLSAEEPQAESKVDLLRIFNEIVYSNLNIHKETLIIIDEAQAITDLDFNSWGSLDKFKHLTSTLPFGEGFPRVTATATPVS